MTNWDASAARRYHEATKHSPASVRRGGRSLDWAKKPHAFKEYVGLEALALPTDVPPSRVAAVEALARTPAEERRATTLADLARLLRFGAGVVRSRDGYHFRTYSSAGALYPIELYLACGDLPGLPAGLYHFHPGELALRQLRAPDVRASLAAAADDPRLAEAGAVVVLTGILSRTAWKYEARGYRHMF